jgi:hypothetical protein
MDDFSASAMVHKFLFHVASGPHHFRRQIPLYSVASELDNVVLLGHFPPETVVLTAIFDGIRTLLSRAFDTGEIQNRRIHCRLNW